MKSLIMRACEEAEAKIARAANNQTTTQYHSLSLEDVNPYDLPEFLEQNNVPRNAYFNCTCDIDNYESGEVEVGWVTEEFLSAKAREEYRNTPGRFNNYVWRIIYQELTAAGWKRIAFCTSLLIPFRGTSVLELYHNREWGRLEDYYRLYFQEPALTVQFNNDQHEKNQH